MNFLTFHIFPQNDENVWQEKSLIQLYVLQAFTSHIHRISSYIIIYHHKSSYIIIYHHISSYTHSLFQGRRMRATTDRPGHHLSQGLLANLENQQISAAVQMPWWLPCRCAGGLGFFHPCSSSNFRMLKVYYTSNWMFSSLL